MSIRESQLRRIVGSFRTLKLRRSQRRSASGADSWVIPEVLEARVLPATFVVTNLNDSGAGSLRQAVDNSNISPGADTIDATGLLGTVVLTSGELRITDSVSLVGPGHEQLSVSGNDVSRVVHFGNDYASAVYEVSGLTLRNGTGLGSADTGNGGAVYFADGPAQDDSLTFTDVVIFGNTALSGGGIYAGGATLNLVNTTVAGNVSTAIGISAGGGGIALHGTQATLTDSIVASNTAAQQGGGILNTTSDSFGGDGNSSLTINGGSISLNTAGRGAGVYSRSLSSGQIASLQVTDALIDENTASLEGGGIWTNGSLSADGATITNNQVTLGRGGGIFLTSSSSPAFIQYSTISHNIVLNDATFGGGGMSVSGSEAHIMSSLFHNNEATAVAGNGYGTQLESRNGTVTLTNVTMNAEDTVSTPILSSMVEHAADTAGAAVLSVRNSTFVGASGRVAIRTDSLLLGSAELSYGNSIFKGFSDSFTTLGVGSVSLTSAGHNIFTDSVPASLRTSTDLNATDPQIGPLQDNGGPTFSHEPVPGGPAVDSGSDALAVNPATPSDEPLDMDQRGSGYERFADGDDDGQAIVDIGAVEYVIPTPRLLAPEGTVTTASPTIQWTAVEGVTSYEIFVANTTTGDNPLLRDSVTGTEYTASSALPLGNYRIYVRGFYSSGDTTPWSDPHSFQLRTRTGFGDLPSNFRTAVPTLTWDSVAGAERYDIWVNNVTTGESQSIRNENVLTPSFTPSAPLPIGRYQIFVRGIGVSGFTGTWAGHSFRVASVPEVTSLTGDEGTFTKRPTFTWEAVPGADSYDLWVRRSWPDVATELIREPALTETEFTPPSDLSFGYYIWWVRAIDADGNKADWTTANTFWTGGRTTVTGPIDTVSDLRPALTWSAVTGASYYSIHVNQVGGPNRVIYEQNVVGTSFVPDFDLQSGATYRVWVRAIAGSGESGVWSREMVFTVADSSATSDDGLPTDSALLVCLTPTDAEVFDAAAAAVTLYRDSASVVPEGAEAETDATPFRPHEIRNSGEVLSDGTVAHASASTGEAVFEEHAGDRHEPSELDSVFCDSEALLSALAL